MTIVEVLIASIIIATVALGALGAIDAATRSTSEERHHAAADGIAQADQARLRSMRISDLANLNQTRTVTEEGTVYTVTSQGTFVTDSTGTASCSAGTASADYIQTSSSVTWSSIGSRPPVTAHSIISPPNGAISSDRGALAIEVDDAQNNGIPNVTLTGSGAGSFSGSTGSTGCVIFGDLPAGDYTLNVSGVAAGLVDGDGNPPGPKTVSVVGQSTNTVVLQYGRPGSINASFTTRSASGSVVASTADSIVVFNTGMTAFATAGTPGTPASTVTASGLFPFSSPDSVYAGTCDGDNPNPSGASPAPVPSAIASVTVPAGGSASASIRLPALYLTVRTGSSSSSPGSLVSGAHVVITDVNCTGNSAKRTFTTNSSGTLADPGQPFSDFQICADATVSGTKRRNYVRSGTSIENVALGNSTAVNSGITRVIYLTGTGNTSGSSAVCS